ncbi:ATP synthase F1 subunit delta [Rhinolophus ferrumequinum]|uniref:ATP synthase F(1) complex subunit delta, mitochondrial n=2 Tax=Rhinolophus ferrumequinum TaxID=59479 RepID=A0A7J7TYX0_RHIFE|nr:ATP synthase F1 subunit delta [Rhinolophus ferrumequinum]
MAAALLPARRCPARGQAPLVAASSSSGWPAFTPALHWGKTEAGEGPGTRAARLRLESDYRRSPAAAMLPASLLRRPGLSRLVRQARAYAEAAAAPAPAAGPGQMSFTFASPTQVFFNGANVRQVDVPTQTGAFGILAAHVPTLQVLRPGLVVVHAEDGTTSKYFVSSGSVTVNADSSVQLLAEEAVTLDMLDLGAAKANLEKAQSELSGAADEVARAEIQIRIEASEALVKALE